MVDVCVNPTCKTAFTTLTTGDLYALENRSANTEFFWLCSACVPSVVPFLDLHGRVSVGSRLVRIPWSKFDAEIQLRLVHSSRESRSWLRTGVAREFSSRSDLPLSSLEAA
ncbi:hypothetical protein HDF16_005693 [Granulicella aggregans]|jgi:hypothetical protein|uniref:Uncharacterized protein n=1 Tax=Granulicella aggregans TaxID=474949 RepID=A0A7W7ZJJ8_9BACT|nr:hypothetical protein [Granulicella aggregans]